jgi:hypothetical protein
MQSRSRQFWNRHLLTRAALLGAFVVLGFVAFADPVLAQLTTANSGGIALGQRSPFEIISAIINIFLGFLTFIVLLIMMYGGWLWMTAAGNEEKIAQAKKVLINATIGLIIILASWGITLWILRAIADATGTDLGGGGGPACPGCSIPGGASSDFRVTSTNPENGQTDVLLCTDVTVRMSLPVDKTTVTADSFNITVENGAQAGAGCTTNNACASGLCDETSRQCVGDTLAGTIGFAPGAETEYFNFVPAKTFEQNTRYRAVVFGGAQGILSAATGDAGGVDTRVSMSQSYEWTFTTGSDTDTVPPTVVTSESSPFPNHKAQDICLNTVINYDFSEAMRITSFNDDVSFVVHQKDGGAIDWTDPINLDGWSFGSDLNYAQARPAEQLQANATYVMRLYGGDAANNFAGAVTDSCGNSLDGNTNGQSEGADIDNFFDTPAGKSEVPIIWETGENPLCTPVIDSIDPNADYYGEFVADNALTHTLTIQGKYLGPNPEVEFQGDNGRTILAAEGVNSCFDAAHIGAIDQDTSKGDQCLDRPLQGISTLKLRTPITTTDSRPIVRVAGESSEPSPENVDSISPHISGMDPQSGSPGQYITLRGENFGETVGTVYLKSLDGTRISELTFPSGDVCGDTWEATEVIAIAPETYRDPAGVEGRWATGDVAYIQLQRPDGRHSDLLPFTFSDEIRPNVCRIDPQCSDTGEASFALFGDRLGEDQGSQRVMFTKLSDISTGYSAGITGWATSRIDGVTNAGMGQDVYWASVYNEETQLSSNGVEYRIPCAPAPNVVELSSCDAENGIYPSPNPIPNSTDACVNAQLGILFDQPMASDAFNDDTVIIEQYNSGDTLNEAYPKFRMGDESEGQFEGFPSVEPWELTIGENTYHGIQFQFTRTPSDPNQDGVADGSSTHLQPNTWYRITATTAVKSAEGIALKAPYTFQFKTKNSQELCALSSIDVSPSSAFKNSAIGDPEAGRQSYQSFAGSAYDAQCRLLHSTDYSWDWQTTNGRVGAFGPERPFQSTENVYVPGSQAENEGTATITASAQNPSLGASVSDASEFTVDFAACETDSDCGACGEGVSSCDESIGRCAPVIQDFSPDNGDNGTWVTINGCYFGGEKGEIDWKNGGVTAATEWPSPDQCGESTWSDNQIIAEVPTLYDSNGDGSRDRSVDPGNYTIALKTSDAATTESSNAFTLNDRLRPGLCRLDPVRGEQGTQLTAVGNNLGDEKGSPTFLSEDDYDTDGRPDRIATIPGVWEDTLVEATVPQGAWSDESGTDGFRVTLPGGDIQCKDDSQCTNPLNFTVSCSSDSDCEGGICSDAGVCESAPDTSACVVDEDCAKACPGSASRCEDQKCTPVIRSLSPDAAPGGSTISVLGCFFDSFGENSGVKFNQTSANLACTDGWSNDRIEVIVPDPVAIGSRSNVQVTRSDGAVTNTKEFSVVNQCPGGQAVPDGGMPVLCEIAPDGGFAAEEDRTNGDRIQFIGDNMTTASRAQFPGDPASDIPFIEGENGSFISEQAVSATIPFDSRTGEAAVSINACLSNTQHIDIQCQTADQCADGAYCVDGVCTDPTVDQCAVCTPGTAAQICGSGAGCSYSVELGQGCCAERPQITGSSVADQQSEVCPNIRLTVDFSEMMTGWAFAKLQKQVDGAYQDVTTTKSFNENQLQLTPPSGHLDVDSQYRLVIPSNDSETDTLRSDATLLALKGGRGEIQFRTAAQTCIPDSVTLEYTETGEEVALHTFTAQDQTVGMQAAVTSRGQEVIPSDQVDWEYIWRPYKEENRCDNVVWIDGEQSIGASASAQMVRSGDQNNGTSAVGVKLSPLAGWTSQDVTDTANVRTFFCEPDKLWEYADDPAFVGTLENQQAYQTHQFPQYFDIVYCMDDSKPALNAPVVTEGGANDDWFLQYLFLNPENLKEAFAIRVFANEENLSPEEWYRRNAPVPGNPNSLLVDGYQAVQDGNSYYVSASNVVPDNDGDGKKDLYNNIYLITFNETDGGVNSLRGDILSFLRFNSNVSMDKCEGSHKAKLTRDTKRVSDLGAVASLANNYYSTNGNYPQPQSQSFGSYIANFTTSAWNSWQGALGNTLGSTLPTDPYNFFYAAENYTPFNAVGKPTPWISEDGSRDCQYDPNRGVYFDESGTCWDPVNSQFFCPSSSAVYAYKQTDAQTAALYAHLEYGIFLEGGRSETYFDRSDVDVTDNVCGGINNADCSCFNYGITSSTPGQTWTPIQ